MGKSGENKWTSTDSNPVYNYHIPYTVPMPKPKRFQIDSSASRKNETVTPRVWFSRAGLSPPPPILAAALDRPETISSTSLESTY